MSWWVSGWASWKDGSEAEWGEQSVVCPSPVTPATHPGRFTDQDEHVIQHCFHYTSTVLTSTLAFQKEQKLKCECQVRGLP